MKYIYALLACLILFPTAPASFAGNSTEFFLGPVVYNNWGTTDYVLKAQGVDDVGGPFDTAFVEVESKLEFPLDVYLVGATAGARGRFGNGRRWTARVEGIINVDDPSGAMKDYDWLRIPDIGYDETISYTESDATMDYLRLSVDFRTTIWQGRKFDLWFLAGFTYNRIEQDIVGYDGWQLSNLQDRVSISGEGIVGYYKVNYYLPQLGLVGGVRPNALSEITLKAAVTRAMASDFDDHILRGKTSEASPSGWGILLRAEGRIILGSEDLPMQPFVTLVGEISSIGTDGTQTQTWYRDEEYADGSVQKAGTVISGIDYEINSTQGRLGLAFGVAF